MPTLSPTLRMLAACVFVMVIGVEAADARKKSPAQVLQEKFERQAAQLPKTCEQFRRLVTEGEPIFPPNSNPRLPASINHAVNMVIEDSRFSPVFGRPLDAFGEEDLRYFSDAYRHCTLSHPQPLADVSADAKRVLWEVFSIGGNTLLRRLELQRSSAKALQGAAAELAALPAVAASAAELSRINRSMASHMAAAPGRPANAYLAAYSAAEKRIALVAEAQNLERQVSGAVTPADLRGLVKTAGELMQQLKSTSDPELLASRELQLEDILAGVATLSAALAEKEHAEYEQLRRKPPAGLQTLADFQSFEAGLNQRYGNLLELPAFETFNRARPAYRADVYAANSAALVAAINRAADSAALEKISRSYIVEADLGFPALAAARTALDARRNIVAPFSAFGGGDYLNAVYSGNVELLQAADAKYFEGYQRIGNSIAQQANSMGVGGLVDDAFDSSNFSLVTPVLTVYLMNYGQTSRSCLRPGYKEYVIGKRMVATEDTPFGARIVEDYGIVSVTHYPVNKEFIPAFDVIGTTDPDDNFAFDVFVNDGKNAALFSGIRTMMAKVPCGDARIARFERNLLSFYSNLDALQKQKRANKDKYFVDRAKRESGDYRQCVAERDRLAIPQPFQQEFMDRCRADRFSVTTGEVEQWRAAHIEIEALTQKQRGGNQPWSRHEGGIRSLRCGQSTPPSASAMYQLEFLRCMERYQLTDLDRKIIRDGEAREARGNAQKQPGT